MDWPAVDWALVAFIGALVGTGELIGRYRDAPERAIRTRPALLYLVLNMAGSVSALLVVRTYGWTLGAPAGEGTEALRWTQVLLAGFGAMAFFRSSFFTLRVGDNDIGIGPSSVLQVALLAADRAVDRLRAEERDEALGPLATQVSFAKAVEALPAYCFGLLQNLSLDDQRRFGDGMGTVIASKTMDEHTKARLLALQLMNVIGPEVLKRAVVSLKSVIAPDPPPAVVQPAPLSQSVDKIVSVMNGVSFDKAHQALPTLCLALMRNVDNATQQRLAEQISALRDSTMGSRSKALLLGLVLRNELGIDDELGLAVSALGPEIREAADVPQPSPTGAPGSAP